jgi:HTH-type transcriptional regulator/antitoxin HigA
LVEEYENLHFPISLPDPIDAIRFAMEQKGLVRKDLIPLLGSQSKVSEVLNRKRSLSLAMIRSLNEGLGIPAEVLLQDLPLSEILKKTFSYRDFPVSDMYVRGYFPGYLSLRAVKDDFDELMTGLFSVFTNEQPMPVFPRQGEGRVNAMPSILTAYQAHILQKLDVQDFGEFSPSRLTSGFF